MAIILTTALADHLGAFGYRGDDWAKFDRAEAKVIRIIDGATVEVQQGNRSETVRLLGLKPAKDFSPVEKMLLDQTVRLKLETLQPRDPEGRLLAYLFLGDDNANLALLTAGHAKVDRSREHTMKSMFELAEAQARKAKRGLWSE